MTTHFQCDVCGSTAPVMIADARRGRTFNLCYAHEYVCRDHMTDPCPTCDREV